jgi:hypothetical protein
MIKEIDMTEPKKPIVEIYHCPETDEYTISAEGWDDFCTFDEQEANDEAESIADEIGGEIVRL